MAGEVKADYLYNLSDMYGVIPYDWVKLTVDKKNNEVLVINSSEQTINVFNDKGMEVYRYDDLFSYGYIADMAVDKNGDLLLLDSSGDVAGAIARCNFRGELLERITLKNLPAAYQNTFKPSAIHQRNDLLYLFDGKTQRVVVTDLHGNYKDEYELASLLGLNSKKTASADVSSFSVSDDGTLFFTAPSLFTVYVVSPDKKVRSFGTPGSTPGKFNILGGVATDDRGYIYVTDVLRCVVMIFDKDFRVKVEFGYRGYDPGNLVSPKELTIHDDKLYVTQSRKQGVSVFHITYD
jgi:DNA-binding beta-propeller fold protein YncE